MRKGELSRVFDVASSNSSPACALDTSTELRLPTLDERVSLYLSAVHGRRDFTDVERADARERILDAMAGDISSKSQNNSRNDTGIFLTEPRIIGIGQFYAPSAKQSEHRLSAEPSFAPCYISDAPDRSLAPPRIALNRRRTSPRRLVLGISAIAAVMALFIVGALRTGWFTDSRNSLEPTVALQSPAELRGIVRLDQGEIEDLLKRGREMAAAGNIHGARLMFNLGAEAGSAAAALELGGTYDPNILEHLAAGTGPVRAAPSVAMQTNVVAPHEESPGVGAPAPAKSTTPILMGIPPDTAMARAWYQKAKDLGSPEAQGRLEKLGGR
jgi:hypothetical protein